MEFVNVSLTKDRCAELLHQLHKEAHEIATTLDRVLVTASEAKFSKFTGAPSTIQTTERMHRLGQIKLEIEMLERAV